MRASLLLGNGGRHTSDVPHSPHCCHQGISLRKSRIRTHLHACDSFIVRQSSHQASRHTCRLPRRQHPGRTARQCETFKPHAAASSGALSSEDAQQQPPEGNLAQYDKLIIGLAVPALGSILLDPIMSLVDTGASHQLLLIHDRRYIGCTPYPAAWKLSAELSTMMPAESPQNSSLKPVNVQ